MSKTTAPLLSFGAEGQIAKSMVYSKWRGVPYARRYVVPANPRTAEQQGTRNIFAMLNQFYALAPSFVTAAFDLYATGRPFLGRNRFIGDNVKLLRANEGWDSMAGLIVSPGARGGLPPSSLDVQVNAGDIDVAFELPQVPSGWTLVNAHALAFVDQPATDAFNQDILSGSDDGEPPAVTLSTSEAGDYVVAGFLEWQKPNGDTAYSRSMAATATVA